MIVTILVLLAVFILIAGLFIQFLPRFYVWVYNRTLKEIEKKRR